MLTDLQVISDVLVQWWVGETTRFASIDYFFWSSWYCHRVWISELSLFLIQMNNALSTCISERKKSLINLPPGMSLIVLTRLCSTMLLLR